MPHMTLAFLLHHVAKYPLHRVEHALGSETLHGALAPNRTEALAQRGFTHQPGERHFELGGIARCNQNTALLVRYGLADRTDRRRNHRQRYAFLAVRGKREHIERVEPALHVVAVADHFYTLVKPGFADQALEVVTLWSIADHQQVPRRIALRQRSERLQQIGMSLPVAQRGDNTQITALGVETECPARLARIARAEALEVDTGRH